MTPVIFPQTDYASTSRLERTRRGNVSHFRTSCFSMFLAGYSQGCHGTCSRIGPLDDNMTSTGRPIHLRHRHGPTSKSSPRSIGTCPLLSSSGIRLSPLHGLVDQESQFRLHVTTLLMGPWLVVPRLILDRQSTTPIRPIDHFLDRIVVCGNIFLGQWHNGCLGQSSMLYIPKNQGNHSD